MRCVTTIECVARTALVFRNRNLPREGCLLLGGRVFHGFKDFCFKLFGELGVVLYHLLGIVATLELGAKIFEAMKNGSPKKK